MAQHPPVPILRTMTATGSARPRHGGPRWPCPPGDPGGPGGPGKPPWAGPPRHRPRSDDGTPRARSADGQVLGALMVLGGVGWLLDRSGVVDLALETVLSVLLLALGVGMVMTARRRGGPGLVVLGVALALVLAATSSIDLRLLNAGIADRSISAATVVEARRNNQLGIGKLDVDLGELTLPESPTQMPTLRYRLAVGQLIVRLPATPDIAVQVTASARGGRIETPDGREQKGSDLDVTYKDEGFDSSAHKLTIDLALGLGSVQVVRESR